MIISPSRNQNNEKQVKIENFAINDQSTYGNKKDLDINKNIKITIEYKEYKNNKLNSAILTKTVNFNPKQYFQNKEEKSTIKNINDLYEVSIEEIFNMKGE